MKLFPCLPAVGLMAFAMLSAAPSIAQFPTFTQNNLVTDNQTISSAAITDGSLVNAWGISYAPAGPFWVSNNGTGTSTLYSLAPAASTPTKLGLTVSIPGDGTITGQAFNAGSASGAFNGDNFLFVNEDGSVSGWRGALGTTAETLAPGSAANVYKGAAFATVNGHSYLYAANFRTGGVDIIKGDAGAPNLTGSFKDAALPAGFAPFGIQKLGNNIYVAYALQDAAKHDDVAGTGNGFVDAFDLNGNFLSRIGSAGTLDSPWGLALAPSSFGGYAGDLLVGNFGDGRINAFNLTNNSFVGQLGSTSGTPLTIDGLWGLIPGNNGQAGSAGTLFFSAGPSNESHGLFGSLRPAAVPEAGSLALLSSFSLTAFIFGLLRFRARHSKREFGKRTRRIVNRIV